MSDAADEIAKNSPGHVGWSEESFVADLQENGLWDAEKYWQLERALYDLCDQDGRDALICHVFLVYARIVKLLGAHLDSMDIFEIVGLSREGGLDMWERVEVVFSGFFCGGMPDQLLFSSVNPYLSDFK